MTSHIQLVVASKLRIRRNECAVFCCHHHHFLTSARLTFISLPQPFFSANSPFVRSIPSNRFFIYFSLLIFLFIHKQLKMIMRTNTLAIEQSFIRIRSNENEMHNNKIHTNKRKTNAKNHENKT